MKPKHKYRRMKDRIKEVNMLFSRLLSLNKIHPMRMRFLRFFSASVESQEGKAPTIHKPMTKIEYLKLKDKKSLAYEKIVSSRNTSKTVLYIPGFKSGKDGNKALFLRQFCIENDFTYIRW